MEQENKQEYIVEELTGRIISVEESGETHKQQKLGLKVKIVALCTAIGISGLGIYNKVQTTNQEVISQNLENAIDNFQNQNLLEIPNKINEIGEEVNQLNTQGSSIELETSNETEKFIINEENNEIIQENLTINSGIDNASTNQTIISENNVLEDDKIGLSMTDEDKQPIFETTPVLENDESLEVVNQIPQQVETHENPAENLESVDIIQDSNSQVAVEENNEKQVQQEVNSISDLPKDGIAIILDGEIEKVNEASQQSVENYDEYSILAQDPVQENAVSTEGKVR